MPLSADTPAPVITATVRGLEVRIARIASSMLLMDEA
jgi:hypothetical protein